MIMQAEGGINKKKARSRARADGRLYCESAAFQRIAGRRSE